MNARLDMVESQVAGAFGSSKQGNQDSKLSKSIKSKTSQKSVKNKTVLSESSDSPSDENEIPSLSDLRVSKKIRKQIDQKFAQLERVKKKVMNRLKKLSPNVGVRLMWSSVIRSPSLMNTFLGGVPPGKG